jgi:hypothetical protein
MYSFSIAVFFQAITLVSISAIADHGISLLSDNLFQYGGYEANWL